MLMKVIKVATCGVSLVLGMMEVQFAQFLTTQWQSASIIFLDEGRQTVPLMNLLWRECEVW